MAALRKVLLAGAFDTKGADYSYVREVLAGAGVDVLVADFGVFSKSSEGVDIPAFEIARAGRANLPTLQQSQDKAAAMEAMSRGLTAIVRDLHSTGRIHGMLALGGTSGTAIATAAMRTLPAGFPKVMVSTVAGGDASAYTGGRDIIMIPSIVDVAGLNRISRPIYRNAALSMAGMLQGAPHQAGNDKPLVAASMFGNTTACIARAREPLERAGYEVVIFHATGGGGRTMQSLADDGLLCGLLDVTTTELADEVCGGVFSAGSERVRMGERSRIPVVLAPGCVDMCNFGAPDTVPAQYRERNLYRWNPNVTLLRTDEAENRRIGELLADTANRCTGAAKVLLPLRGVSMLDSPSHPFWDPKADAACFQALRQNLRRDIPCIEIDANINDPEFADRAAAELLELLNTHTGDEIAVYETRNSSAS